MMLSTEGAVLLAYADAVAATRSRTPQLPPQPGHPHGVLRIGSPATLLSTRLPTPLRRFHQRWPQVSLEIASVSMGDLPQAVACGEIDCGVLPGGATGAEFAALGLGYDRLWSESLVLIESACQAPSVTILGKVQGCGYQALLPMAQIECALGGNSEVMEMSSSELLLANVVSGRCRAIVPKSLLRSQRGLNGVRTTPLGSVAVWLIWRENFSPSTRQVLREVLIRHGEVWH